MAIASISHQGKTLRFRTNPNSITWDYNLKTNVEETYGGQVVQVLSANIDNLRITADAGRGGWPYIESVALFFRDMLFDQREGRGEPGVFRYPGRGWELKVFALNFPFKDSVTDILKEFTLSFRVQEDVTGIVTSSLIETEMAKMSKGIGWERNDYNTPALDWTDGEYTPTPMDLSTRNSDSSSDLEDGEVSDSDKNMIVDPNNPPKPGAPLMDSLLPR